MVYKITYNRQSKLEFNDKLNTNYKINFLIFTYPSLGFFFIYHDIQQGCQGPAKSKIRTARAGTAGPAKKFWAGRAGKNNLGRQGRREKFGPARPVRIILAGRTIEAYYLGLIKSNLFIIMKTSLISLHITIWNGVIL